LVLGQPDWETHLFPVELTGEQVESSPNIDLAKPISRQQELELQEHYQWPLYWSAPGGIYYLGAPPTTIIESILGVEQDQAKTGGVKAEQNDPHLRSAWEILGYHIRARDDEIGHVEDFIVDDEVWIIRYMAVDTRNWGSGKKVLLAPQWIEAVNWTQAQVHVDLALETIKNSPEFNPGKPVDQGYEAELYDYYDRPKYWQ